VLTVFEEVETVNDKPETEYPVVDNVLTIFTVLTEITFPVVVAPEFVIRDAKLD
jgi:hypothetical protein